MASNNQNIDQSELDLFLKLYFKQPKVLYQHLFSSYHQLIEEIIPNKPPAWHGLIYFGFKYISFTSFHEISSFLECNLP